MVEGDRCMTDEAFQSLLDKLSVAQDTYRAVLGEAEEEYEARFGSNPSAVDDDF